MPEAAPHPAANPSVSLPSRKPSWTRDWPNLSIAGLTIVLALYTAWVGWAAIRGDDTSLPAVVITPVTKVAATPQLKLNQTHQRLGLPVKVDQAQIGKTDPFTQ
jgi:hypothetical protein